MRQLDVLTGLRGIAAYAVLIAHAVDFAYLGQLHAWVAGLVYFGMSLFFVLSGFVICYNYSGILNDGVASGAWRFFVARFARLYPLYIVMLAVSVLIEPHDYLIAGAGVAALTLTQSWLNVQGVSGSIFGQSWSISTEWFFYVFFLFICVPLARLRLPGRALSLFLVLGFAFVVLVCSQRALVEPVVAALFYNGQPINAPAWQWFTYFGPALRVLEFVAGALACMVYLNCRDRQVQDGTILVACGLWCGAWVVLGGLLQDGVAADLLHSFAFAPAIAWGLVVLCRRNRVPVLSSRPMMVLGEISYSVYVAQFLVFVQLSPGWAYGPAAFAAVSVLLITAIGGASYWLFERPARRILRAVMSTGLSKSRTGPPTWSSVR